MTRARTLYLLLFSLAMSAATPLRADDGKLVEQRKHYLDARVALAAGKVQNFRKLANGLTDYPLYGYLQYDDLSRRLAEAKVAEVSEFLDRYADSPISARLRSKWLLLLAQQKRWKNYLAFYTPQEDDELRCYELLARLNTGKIQGMMQDVERAWLVAHTQPATCDPVFAAWERAGGLNGTLVWKRVRLAMDAGRVSTAQEMKRYLSSEDSAWVDLWARVRANPAQHLDDPALKQDLAITRDILRHGVLRLLRHDADAAYARWTALKPRYKFAAADIATVDREIALAAAYRQHPQALDWLNALQSDSEQVAEWRSRSALARNDWPTLRRVINDLPATELQKELWQYWKARTLAELGQVETEPAYSGVAFDVFDSLAGGRGYYNFLSADRLTRAYDFNHASIEYTSAELQSIADIPGIQRAHELLFLDLASDARREWLLATAHMEPRQLQLAAVLAHQWGWHDRAIFTVARGGIFDDMEVRFPMVYQDQVSAVARKYNLDPAWVYGIMRQESAFMPDARSPAGAMGLMQLMPATASITARLIKSPMKNHNELYDVDRNLELGSAYLKQMSDQFGGNMVLATAAYNAGPNRVKQWIARGEQPADNWIETIPFGETREYVKRVLTYTTIFEQRLTGNNTRMSQRMPAIKP